MPDMNAIPCLPAFITFGVLTLMTELPAAETNYGNVRVSAHSFESGNKCQT